MDRGGCLRSSSCMRSNVKPSIPFCRQNLSIKFEKFKDRNHCSTSFVVHDVMEDFGRFLKRRISRKQNQFKFIRFTRSLFGSFMILSNGHSNVKLTYLSYQLFVLINEYFSIDVI